MRDNSLKINLGLKIITAFCLQPQSQWSGLITATNVFVAVPWVLCHPTPFSYWLYRTFSVTGFGCRVNSQLKTWKFPCKFFSVPHDCFRSGVFSLYRSALLKRYSTSCRALTEPLNLIIIEHLTPKYVSSFFSVASPLTPGFLIKGVWLGDGVLHQHVRAGIMNALPIQNGIYYSRNIDVKIVENVQNTMRRTCVASSPEAKGPGGIMQVNQQARDWNCSVHDLKMQRFIQGIHSVYSDRFVFFPLSWHSKVFLTAISEGKRRK